MANVNDVANFFVDWANRSEEEHMTNLWLNKLLFFAQGQCLARYGKPLFNDAIEAWDYGPVIPAVYRKYKGYGRNPISVVDDEYTPAKFTTDERILLADVLREYGVYNASALVSKTHQPNTPWSDAYIEGANNEITPASMKDYFQKPENGLKCFEQVFSTNNLKAIGRRDADGYLVLPKDEDDGDDWDEL